MLYSPKPRLEEVVVELLAQKPGLSVSQLAEQIARRTRRFSVPALYQELRKLREQAVVVKVKDRFSLRLGWVQGMIQLTDNMYDAYIGSSQIGTILPLSGSSQTWKFTNLRALGAFATQLLLIVLQESKTKDFFEWVPQAWFPLAHGAEESQFLQAIRYAAVKHYMIIGSDNMLNRQYEKQVEKEGVVVSFAPSPFADEQDRYFTVAGDFVGTMKLSPEIVAAMAELFSEAVPSNLQSISRSVSLIQRKAKLSISIEHRPNKAKKLRKTFCEFFGV